MTSPAGNRRSDGASPTGGFTLIELVLVMTILVVVLSASAPSLRTFFRGRALDSEARRFLALTRYAQSRAVSEGLPVTLWINAVDGKYGQEIQAGYVDASSDNKSSEHQLDRDLSIEVNYLPRPAAFRTAATVIRPVNANEVVIRFTPEGFIAETNPEEIVIREGKRDAVRIAPSRNRLNYEIKTNQFETIGR